MFHILDHKQPSSWHAWSETVDIFFMEETVDIDAYCPKNKQHEQVSLIISSSTDSVGFTYKPYTNV